MQSTRKCGIYVTSLVLFDKYLKLNAPFLFSVKSTTSKSRHIITLCAEFIRAYFDKTAPPEPRELLFDKCDSIRLLCEGLIRPTVAISGMGRWVAYFRDGRLVTLRVQKTTKQLINSNLLIFYEQGRLSDIVDSLSLSHCCYWEEALSFYLRIYMKEKHKH